MYELASSTLILSAVICCILFVLQLGLLDDCIVSESNFLSAFCSPITSHVILSMSNNSMSGIPSSAGLSPNAPKNLHLANLYLYFNLNIHLPNYSIIDSFCFLVWLNCFLWHKSCYCWFREYGPKNIEWHQATIASGVYFVCYVHDFLTSTLV